MPGPNNRTKPWRSRTGVVYATFVLPLVIWASARTSWWLLPIFVFAFLAPSLNALIPSERLEGWLDASQWIAPLFVFVGTSLVVGDRVAGHDFHAVAAQVIPVLVLALAVERRALSVTGFRDTTDRLIAIMMMLGLGYGEYQALAALTHAQASRIDVVSGAIAGGFAAVAVTGLLARNTDREQEVQPGASSTQEESAPGKATSSRTRL